MNSAILLVMKWQQIESMSVESSIFYVDDCVCLKRNTVFSELECSTAVI
jgi:hypothetical protein